jgi:hypothetical protein
MNPDTLQMFELSDYFHQLGNAFGTFIQDHKYELSDKERNDLFDKQIALLQISGDINIMGVSLVFNDVQESVNELNTVTSAIKKTVKKVLAIQTITDIAAAAINVGAAILSKNPNAILSKTDELKTKLGDIESGPL